MPNTTKRWFRLVFAKRTPGICRICGCTMYDPCYSPEHGYCWWWDAEETLCSHCADKRIFQKPNTIHCVNTDNPTI